MTRLAGFWAEDDDLCDGCEQPYNPGTGTTAGRPHVCDPYFARLVLMRLTAEWN